jgi:hypothetical protein
MLTAMAIATRAIPIPFVPDRVLFRIRGAIVQDVAARNGLSLTSDARDLLASPSPEKKSVALVRKAVEIISDQILKRMGPLAAISAAARAIEVYALGHLTDRYIREVREPGPVRIHGEEARKLRELIDRSVLRAMSPSLAPRSTTVGEPAEDLRDEFTRWFDAILLTSAALPGYVERRLEAAFDELAAEVRERRG